jgi:hypothetical protein
MLVILLFPADYNAVVVSSASAGSTGIGQRSRWCKLIRLLLKKSQQLQTCLGLKL